MYTIVFSFGVDGVMHVIETQTYTMFYLGRNTKFFKTTKCGDEI